MPSFTVYKGNDSGVPKAATTTKPDELVGDQVYVRVTASGVCGTDLHFLKEDMVLGHEGIAVVEKLGPNVKNLQVGDRVGWGYCSDACGLCQRCLEGEDVFCPERQLYSQANRDQGSFASHGVWREAFLHKIPDDISDEDAAPLQCAGATVYTTFENLKPNECVAIMGVGGLGHLAIQFAAKLGCRVVVISGTDSKKEEALRLGAHEFIAMSDRSKSHDAPLRWPIDRLLVTTSAQPDWAALLPMMATKSKIYPLSVSSGNFEIPYMPLLAQGITVVGSLVATRAVHREMLQFAAVHQIKPVKEVFPLTEEGVQQAIAKLDSGKMHFRAVLKAQ